MSMSLAIEQHKSPQTPTQVYPLSLFLQKINISISRPVSNSIGSMWRYLSFGSFTIWFFWRGMKSNCCPCNITLPNNVYNGTLNYRDKIVCYKRRWIFLLFSTVHNTKILTNMLTIWHIPVHIQYREHTGHWTSFRIGLRRLYFSSILCISNV